MAEVVPGRPNHLSEHLVDLPAILGLGHLPRAPEIAQPVQANPSRRFLVESRIGPVTAPPVPLQFSLEVRRDGLPLVFRTDGVEVEVFDQLPGVGVFLDQVRFETALEQVPASPMPPRR